jgi:hypothetical protein
MLVRLQKAWQQAAMQQRAARLFLDKALRAPYEKPIVNRTLD